MKRLQCHKSQEKREAQREQHEKNGEMERKREKETAVGLTISSSSVTFGEWFQWGGKNGIHTSKG